MCGLPDFRAKCTKRSFHPLFFQIFVSGYRNAGVAVQILVITLSISSLNSVYEHVFQSLSAIGGIV